MLIVFEASHPLGPVAGLDLAGSGPDVCRVELPMPLQRPQFLEPDLPDRAAIHKKTIYVPTVPVDADKIHFTGSGGNFLDLSGAVGVMRVDVKIGTIMK